MEEQSLRLVIAGGGTGGHVLPALAVLEELHRRSLPVDPLWIGSAAGLEREAADRRGIAFKAIPTGKLRRYLDWRTLGDAGRVPVGVAQAWRHLRAHRPDVVFSTGGFVSVPTVLAAARLAPILTHEQTATLGLATKINARFADVLALSWEGSVAARSGVRCRTVVTGNPVRSSLANGDAERARFRYGFHPHLPLLYVTGGARGASPINDRVRATLPALLAHCQVLHQAGPSSANTDAGSLLAARDALPEELRRRYQVVEFVGDELADVYAAADLVLGRAGAGTVAELACFGLPSVLIPLPGAGGDEQTRNGRLLANAGGAVLIQQPDASPERLTEVLINILHDPERRRGMAERARTVGRPGAAANLVDELIDLARKR